MHVALGSRKSPRIRFGGSIANNIHSADESHMNLIISRTDSCPVEASNRSYDAECNSRDSGIVARGTVPRKNGRFVDGREHIAIVRHGSLSSCQHLQQGLI